MVVVEMQYHKPGWKLVRGTATYKVWGPGEVTHGETRTGVFRDGWIAMIMQDGATQTTYTGDSEDVLTIFPTRVAAAFRARMAKGTA